MTSTKWQGRDVVRARAIVAARGPQCCSRCGRIVEPAVELWDVDHLTARVEGGSDTVDNYWIAHRACNRSAGAQLGAARRAALRTGEQAKDARIRRW